ncbi:hypothetical protein PCL_05728 [Purpureocillium lilacinum]|uniref:Uncharacterized protein n=1 Tax=Purpureocillium lilacinum TaxID=33203 RepID=A0A2U3EKU7_PURLI|nr:hypothetical protein PCL_05728 [Purpureocillium lilacinum]
MAPTRLDATSRQPPAASRDICNAKPRAGGGRRWQVPACPKCGQDEDEPGHTFASLRCAESQKAWQEAAAAMASDKLEDTTSRTFSALLAGRVSPLRGRNHTLYRRPTTYYVAEFCSSGGAGWCLDSGVPALKHPSSRSPPSTTASLHCNRLCFLSSWCYSSAGWLCFLAPPKHQTVVPPRRKDDDRHKHPSPSLDVSSSPDSACVHVPAPSVRPPPSVSTPVTTTGRPVAPTTPMHLIPPPPPHCHRTGQAEAQPTTLVLRYRGRWAYGPRQLM